MAKTLKEIQDAVKDLLKLNKLTKETTENHQRAADAIKEGATALQDWKQLLTNIQNNIDSISDNLDYIGQSFKDSVNELQKSNVAIGMQRSSLNKLSSIARKLSDIRRGEVGYTDKELKQIEEQIRLKISDLALAKQLLLKAEVEDENKIKAITSQIAVAEKLVAAYEEIERVNKEINRELGIMPGVLAGIDKAVQKLGFGELGIDDALSKTKQIGMNAKAMGEDFDALGTLAGELGGKLKAAFSPMNLALLAVGFIVDAMMDLDKRTGQIAKNFGISYDAASGISGEMNDTANSSYLTHITTQELTDTFIELNNRYGTFAKMNTDNLIVFQELKDLAGLSSEAIGTISDLTLLTGEHAEDITKEILGQAAAYNAINGTALNEKQILEGINDVSSATLLSLDKSPGAIADAVIQAKALGLEMSQIEAIADSLLKFESSITTEMEAELLTGKSLNLEQARYYALTNNVGGLAKELAKNIGTSAEFGKMTRIEQEKLAAAVGMSKDELANTLKYQEELAKQGKDMNKVTEAWTKAIKEGKSIEEARAIVGDNAYTNMLASQTAGEKFTDQINKLKEAFIPIAQALMPVVEAFADIFTVIGPIVGWTAKWGKWLLYAFGIYKGIQLVQGGILKGMKLMSKVSVSESILGKSYKGGQFMPGGGRAAAGGERVGGLFGKQIAKETGDIKKADEAMKPGGGAGIKDTLSNLGAGLKKMAGGKVTQGIGNLALSGPAMIIALPAIPFLSFMGLTPLPKLKSNLTGLGKGLQGMSKAAVGALVLALAGPALALASLSIPFLTFMAIPAIGAGIGAGLGSLAVGLAAFGNPATAVFVLIGVGLLAALGAAFIPFTYALSKLSPLIKAFGNIIMGVFASLPPIITAVAEGFATMFGAVTLEKAGALLLMGPALFGIAAGLSAIALAGFAALPVLGALTGLGLVAGPLGAIFGEEGGGEAGNDGIIKKLEEVNQNILRLIGAVESGGDVYIDGAKAGRSLVLAASKMG